MTEKERTKYPLFSLGQVVATVGALDALETAKQTPDEFITRHVTGDWGDLVEEDRVANDEALIYGNRLFSSYTTAEEKRLWVITGWDRSVTTLLLPWPYTNIAVMKCHKHSDTSVFLAHKDPGEGTALRTLSAEVAANRENMRVLFRKIRLWRLVTRMFV